MESPFTVSIRRPIYGGGGGGGGGGIGYQVSDITSTKCSFGYFSLDTPTPFAVLTVFLDNT